MQVDSVKAVWDSFMESCCLDLNPSLIEQFKHVFYAAFESAMICTLSAPHRFAGDGEAMTKYLQNMVVETEEYFEQMARGDHGKR